MSQLALFGGNPIGAVNPPPYPRFTSKAIDRVKDLLERGATVGLNKTNPEIAEVETAISQWHDVPHCLSVASGHAALHAEGARVRGNRQKQQQNPASRRGGPLCRWSGVTGGMRGVWNTWWRGGNGAGR